VIPQVLQIDFGRYWTLAAEYPVDILLPPLANLLGNSGDPERTLARSALLSCHLSDLGGEVLGVQRVHSLPAVVEVD